MYRTVWGGLALVFGGGRHSERLSHASGCVDWGYERAKAAIIGIRAEETSRFEFGRTVGLKHGAKVTWGLWERVDGAILYSSKRCIGNSGFVRIGRIC